MKYLVAIALAMCIAAVAADEVCYREVEDLCSGNVPTGAKCTANYGAFSHDGGFTQEFINMQLSKSYEYLLMASYYDNYVKNRPGFHKLYKSLSDRSFDDTIDLIKQVTRRGGSVSFAEIPSRISLNNTVEVNELQSLAKALDSEKELAREAFHLHYYSTHGHKPSGNDIRSRVHIDPEMAHYIEEKFLAKQAASIRKLSGHVNDLRNMLDANDPSLSIYLFDQYLEK